MGRDAGFLTAASALARERDDDGPHLIYLPEVPFTIDKFVRDVKAAMKKYGRCVCAISEGIRGKDGVPIGALLGSGEKDSHGNVQMSGTGALGDYLAAELKAKSGIKRVRADTFGYLQRSFPGIQSKSDLAEAMGAGEAAVAAALNASEGFTEFPTKGTIGIVRKSGKRYAVKFEAMPAEAAAKYTRSVPKEFIAKNGHDVTPAFIEYAKPIVGPLPHCEVI
jgi:6-phosphofructokinase 1